MSDVTSWSEELVQPSEPLRIARARETIRHANVAAGRRFLVLDDDPTGSQAVHDVDVVTAFDVDLICRALRAPGSTCFVLTNSRSLAAAEASALAARLGQMAGDVQRRLGGIVEIVSRGDSTLRGHVLDETRALDAARRGSEGAGYDAIVFAPSFLESGRFTVGDVHWASNEGRVIPVGETEYARDASFGYASSNLRDFLAERSDGEIAPSDVTSISLEDIRVGGPQQVRHVLSQSPHGAFVVVNGVDYADLEVVVLAIDELEVEGARFLFRSGPSLVQVLAGIEAAAPLTAGSIWPDGHPARHGIVVVGSHVGLTNQQVEVLREGGTVVDAQLDVEAALDPTTFVEAVSACVAIGRAALPERDVLLVTSREVRLGKDAADSLAIARRVSAALVAVVRELLDLGPAWIVAKGGITSNDVLVDGLGVRRARVVGQLFPGAVSVFRPLEALPAAVGLPFVVFPGNVGSSRSLLDAATILRGGF